MPEDRTDDGIATDVVFGLSFETWDDLVRREFARPPDRMAQFLLRSPLVGSVLVGNPWRSVGSQLKRRTGSMRDAGFPTSPTAHLVRPIRLRRADSGDVARVERSYRHYGRLVRLEARRRGLRKPVLITYNPLFAAFGEHSSYRSVTYVARDDWVSYHGTPHLRAAYERAYEVIRRKGLRVCAVSEELMSRIAPTGPNQVVPNGVDPAVWMQQTDVPEQMRDLPRPIAVYTGTIDERLSVAALRSLSAELRPGTVLLIGPRDQRTVATLRAEVGDIQFVDSMKQSALARYVAAADVCVLPHVNSTLTRAMSPLKVYEYLAAGCRVVATDLPPIHGISPSIEMVADENHFGAATIKALDRDTPGEAERVQFIADNSWDTRCRSILEVALHE